MKAEDVEWPSDALNEVRKRTLLYRYLRLRRSANAVFLNRNLTYMHDSDEVRGCIRPSLEETIERLRGAALYSPCSIGSRRSSSSLSPKLNESSKLYLDFVFARKGKASVKCDPLRLVVFLKKTNEVTQIGCATLSAIASSDPVRISTNIPCNAACSFVITLTALTGNSNPPSPKRIRLETAIATSDYNIELNVRDNESIVLQSGDYELTLDSSIPQKSVDCRKLIALDSYQITSQLRFSHHKLSGILRFKVAWQPQSTSFCDGFNRSESSNGSSSDESRVWYRLCCSPGLQRTEWRCDLMCPWCGVDCRHQYGLMMHLTFQHWQFVFTAAPHPSGGLVITAGLRNPDCPEVCNLEDMQKLQCSELITVKRRTRPSRSLDQFRTDRISAEEYQTISSVTGHRRPYFHALSGQSKSAANMEYDSEDDWDHMTWFTNVSRRMVDDFVDVNSGEKAFMTLWNEYLLRKPCTADCQLRSIVLAFLRDSFDQLLEKKIVNNFVLHLCNLYEYDLISNEFLANVVMLLWDLCDDHQLKKSVQHSPRESPLRSPRSKATSRAGESSELTSKHKNLKSSPNHTTRSRRRNRISSP